MKKQIGHLAAGLFLLGATEAWGQASADPDPQYYAFHPRAVLTLGAGFSPNNLAAVRQTCISATPRSLDPGALSTNLTNSVVFTSDQLKVTLGLDQKVDANFLDVGGGSGHFNFSYNGLFKEDTLNLVLTASTVYARTGLAEGAKLTEQAQALLANGVEFERICGSRYVAIEHRGASVSVILTIHNVSRDVRTSLQADMSAKGGFGPISGSASTNVQAEVTSAAASKRLGLQVVATGGEGIAALRDLVTAQAAGPDAFDKMLASIAGYLATLKPENAAPTGFSIGSMANFGWNPDAVDLWSALSERRMREIVAEYRRTAAALDVTAAMRTGEDPRVRILAAPQVAAIVSAVPTMEEYLGQLAEAHRNCRMFSNAQCVVPRKPPGLVDVPDLPSPPRVQYLVRADGQYLDSVTSRLVAGDGRYSILQRVQAFRPATAHAAIYLVVDGSYMQTTFLRPVGGLPTDPSRMEFLFSSDNGEEALDRRIFNHMMATGSGDETFSIDITDSLGRQVSAPIMRAKWEMSPTSVTLNSTTLFP